MSEGEQTARQAPLGRQGGIPLWGLLVLVAGTMLAVAFAGVWLGNKQFWIASEGPTPAERSMTAWEDMVRQRPNDRDSWFELSQQYIRSGRYDDALQALETTAKLSGGLAKAPELDYFIGLALLEKGEPAKAVPHLKKIADLSPAAPLPYYDLARAYLRLGKTKEALDAVNFILNKIDPTLADVIALRGQVYEKMGDKRNAAADFGQALAFDPSLQEAKDGFKRLGLPLPREAASGFGGLAPAGGGSR